MEKQLDLFDLSQLRASDGTFASKRTLRRENRFRESVKYIHSITNFQPVVIRQLSERILELEAMVKHKDSVIFNLKNKKK